jgi:hypothetical protein
MPVATRAFSRNDNKIMGRPVKMACIPGTRMPVCPVRDLRFFSYIVLLFILNELMAQNEQ